MMDAMKILAEAERLAPTWGWKRRELPEGTISYVWHGGDGWTATVASFPISATDCGYDGAVAHGDTVVRMPREVAERIFRVAEGR